MLSSLVITAFVMGLLGSVHCIGMCGGIIGSLSMSLSTQVKPKPAPLLWYLLNYNFGRILSYTIAGAFVGFLSQYTIKTIPNGHQFSMMIANVFIILLGLYISQIWMGLSKIEQWATPIWRKIQPFSQPYFPPSSPSKAFPLGIIWGWLPCGLVYSALPLAFSAGSAIEGGIVMLVFGLATLPMLLLLGNSALYVKTKMQNKKFRLILGMLLVLWGGSQLLNINPVMADHSQHAHH